MSFKISIYRCAFNKKNNPQDFPEIQDRQNYLKLLKKYFPVLVVVNELRINAYMNVIIALSHAERVNGHIGSDSEVNFIKNNITYFRTTHYNVHSGGLLLHNTCNTSHNFIKYHK